MALFINAPFSNVTTYRHDYYPRPVEKPFRYYPTQEYKDPIKGPLEEHLLPYRKYNLLPPNQTEYPDPKEYAEHVADHYPATRVFLRETPGGPPDFDSIDRIYDNENRTTYMVAYCKLGDFDSKKKRKREKTPLPEGWIIPLTTQRCGYRDPKVISPGEVEILVPQHPKDNLVPNENLRRILNVKTGDTIYMSDIGNTGTEIIEGKLHGDVNIRPHFEPDELIRAKLIKSSI